MVALTASKDAVKYKTTDAKWEKQPILHNTKVITMTKAINSSYSTADTKQFDYTTGK